MGESITEEEIREVFAANPRFAGKEIVMAPSDGVESLRPFVQRVVDAIGYRSAWVTDESMVGDFCLDESELAEASQKLGVEVKDDDYIVAVAERVRDRDKRG